MECTSESWQFTLEFDVVAAIIDLTAAAVTAADELSFTIAALFIFQQY